MASLENPMQCLSAPNSRASRKQSELGYRVQRGMSMGVEWQWFIVCTVDGFEMEMSLMSFFFETVCWRIRCNVSVLFILYLMKHKNSETVSYIEFCYEVLRPNHLRTLEIVDNYSPSLWDPVHVQIQVTRSISAYIPSLWNSFHTQRHSLLMLDFHQMLSQIKPALWHS